MIRHAKAEMIPCGSRSAKMGNEKYIKITSIASNSQKFAKDVHKTHHIFICPKRQKFQNLNYQTMNQATTII
jgi:hypothetical protein